MSTTYPSDLTETEWTCVQRHLPSLSTRRGRPRTHPLRRILDAIFYVVRTGCAWRYLPCNFPPWQTVFYHFRRLRLSGRWHLLYMAHHRAERVRVGRHPDPSAGIMDSQSVTTVEESAHLRGYEGSCQDTCKTRTQYTRHAAWRDVAACYLPAAPFSLTRCRPSDALVSCLAPGGIRPSLPRFAALLSHPRPHRRSPERPASPASPRTSGTH
jgi:transposase